MDTEDYIRSLEENWKKLEIRINKNFKRKYSSLIHSIEPLLADSIGSNPEEIEIFRIGIADRIHEVNYMEISNKLKSGLLEIIEPCYEDARKWLYDYLKL